MAYVKADTWFLQQIAATGLPLVGGSVSAYITGTTTPLAMHTDSAGGGSATSFTLNSLGMPQSAGGTAVDIYLNDAYIYKFIVRDAEGTAVPPTIDPVYPGGGNGENATFATLEDLRASSYSGNTATVIRAISGGPVVNMTLQNTGTTGGTPTLTAARFTALAAGEIINEGGYGYALSTGQQLSEYMFGAVADWDGATGTDNTTAIQNYLTFTNKPRFVGGPYLMNSGVSLADDDIAVDFGETVFVNGGAGYLFTFGTAGDTPSHEKLRIYGGEFKQSNPATTSNLNYIRVLGVRDFVLDNQKMHNVSNGGITVETGCEDGLIIRPYARDASGYSTCRAVWCNGGSASDYASQLVDISSITRNATAVPVYGVKNVKVLWPDIKLPAYGVYFINTSYGEVHNGRIDISGGSARCVAFNNYSPYGVVDGTEIIGDQSATGILCTQYSIGCEIRNVTSRGTFGGGRDIYVAYLATATIKNTKLRSNSTQQIMIDMGGSAVIDGCEFDRASGYSAGVRAIRIDTIDAAVAGTSTYGNTATTLPGSVIKNNTFRTRCVPVYVNTPTAQNGNIPGLDTIVETDNVFYDFDNAATSDEYGMRILANGSTYTVAYRYERNTMFPSANAIRNRPNITGSGYTAEADAPKFATFRITNAAGGGTITSAKLWGDNFSCAVSRSTDSALISPRTINGGAGASVALLVGVIGADGVVYSAKTVVSGANYLVSVFDSAGTQVTLSTAAAVFDVTIQHSTT